jgi:hypothetical protein
MGPLSFNGLISEQIQRPTLNNKVKRERAGPVLCWAQFGKIKRKERRKMNLAQLFKAH